MATQKEYCPFDDEHEHPDDFGNDHPFEQDIIEKVQDEHPMFDEGDESDDSNSGPSGRRSPTESLLARRAQRQVQTRQELQYRDQSSLAQNHPSVHQGNTVDLCGGAYEVLETPSDNDVPNSGLKAAPVRESSQTALRSETNVAASFVHGKRGPPKTPSPAEQVNPLQRARLGTFQRSRSASHLLGSSYAPASPGLRQTPQSPRRGAERFFRYREPQHELHSASSVTSSDSAPQGDVHHAQLNPLVTQRQAFQALASPSRSRMHSLSSQDLAYPLAYANSNAAHLEAEVALQQYRRDVRGSHPATDGWYQLYESLDLGSIPTPAQCVDAPPSQKYLAQVPMERSLRKNSILGHFYSSHSISEFVCQVVGSSGTACGQRYKKTGGGRSRKNHVLNQHPELYEAVREFRTYQWMVRGFDQPLELEEDEAPATPKTKFEVAREGFVLENMKRPLPHEQNVFEDYLLKSVVNDGVSFNYLNSDSFRGICATLNPLFSIPSTDVLQSNLDSKVMKMRQHITQRLTYLQIRGAITADGWTSADQRKFLGVTFHFITPTFEPATVVIGMERMHGSQTAEVLLKKLCKVNTASTTVYVRTMYNQYLLLFFLNFAIQ
ncbi:hypothetical protein EDD11_000001 [Mortierella claussenii]|nr:hypothetical protein EDD11_000001 [Mortierella claussenii]